MSDTVLVEDQGAVRVLTLNRPSKLNAMNAELVDTLIGAVRAADLDDAVAVVQLAGFNHDALWMTKRTIQRAASMSPAEALEMAGDASLVMRLHGQRGALPDRR